MKVVILFSGGKDSVYATHLCLSWGWEVEWLTLHPQEDSMMFHHPNTRWCGLQAEAAGIQWHEIRAASHENELDDLEEALGRLKAAGKIEGIVSGAIASEYQKQRIEVIGENVGLPTFAPLWHKKPDILREMLEQMEVYLVSASAQGLDEKWLGRRLEPKDVDRFLAMRPAIHPFLEGGEGETFVCDAPFFRKKIRIKKMEKTFEGQSGRVNILEAVLKKKV
ncbi:MAG: diphthine--ammonia ligase [Candidatus Micrarchaeota archaeon]